MARQRKKPLPSPSDAAKLSSQQPVAAEMAAAGSWSVRTQWIFFAMASGACAAFNGVFAKLTTTELTTDISNAIAGALGLSSKENIVEYIVRGGFFGLNLTFNGVMWTLFTTALARGTSTTQVAIMNTSTNFVFTALLGFFIFSEALPPVWWVGAAMLVAGNVIVGRKDDTKDSAGAEGGYVPVSSQEADGDGVDEDEDIADLGDAAERNR